MLYYTVITNTYKLNNLYNCMSWNNFLLQYYERNHISFKIHPNKVMSQAEVKKRNYARVLALKHTKLKESCEYCGSKQGLQRHHPDYNIPTYIITLCKQCHSFEHSNKHIQ